MIPQITIERGTNTIEKISVQYLINNKYIDVNIEALWSSFIVLMVNISGTVLLQWNWQADGGLLSGYQQASINSDYEGDIFIPFSESNSLLLPLGNANLIVKYTTLEGLKDEFPKLENAIKVIETPAKLKQTE